jgi:hypothetical protein
MKEKKVFDLAGQPFSPINIINEVYQRTGNFDDHTLTTIALLDTDSSSMMFKLDELSLESNIDSLADQIINFNSEQSMITKPFLPQLSLKVNRSPLDLWQSPFLRSFVSGPFKKLIDQI